MSQISIVVEDAPIRKGEETLKGSVLRATGPVMIETEILQKSFTRLTRQIGQIFKATCQEEDIKPRKVELWVEIGAEGNISLIGTTKSNVKGAVKLVFEL